MGNPLAGGVEYRGGAGGIALAERPGGLAVDEDVRHRGRRHEPLGGPTEAELGQGFARILEGSALAQEHAVELLLEGRLDGGNRAPVVLVDEPQHSRD